MLFIAIPNDAIVHGIPRDYIIKEGDILSIDVGVSVNGFHADAALTYGIGKIVSKLESLNLKDETLIIYAGDNGTTRGIVSMMGDKKIIGGKGLTSDTGTHVPLICNWPKIVPEGTVIDDLVDASDFLPTMLEISDIEHSDITDGRSFYPQIRGDKGNPREWIYFYFDPASPRLERPVSEFVREKKWKLYSDDRMFNVLDDPDEKNIISWDQNEETKATYTKLKKILTNIIN